MNIEKVFIVQKFTYLIIRLTKIAQLIIASTSKQLTTWNYY